MEREGVLKGTSHHHGLGAGEVCGFISLPPRAFLWRREGPGGVFTVLFSFVSLIK